MRTLPLPRRGSWLSSVLALAAVAVALCYARPAAADDSTATANTLLTDSGSYMPPKPTPVARPRSAHVAKGKPAGRAKVPHGKGHAKAGAHGKSAHGKAAHGKGHAGHAKPGPNARAKTVAPKRAKGSRKA